MTPKGGRDALEGVVRLSDGAALLKLRVRAPPEGDAANRSVLALLAAKLDLPHSRLSIKAGATKRVKTVLIDGNGAELARRLAALIA